MIELMVENLKVQGWTKFLVDPDLFPTTGFCEKEGYTCFFVIENGVDSYFIFKSKNNSKYPYKIPLKK